MVEFNERQTAANADEESVAPVSANELGAVSVPPRSAESHRDEATT